MKDKKYSKDTEKKYGFDNNTRIIYLYHDKHRNIISVSKNEDTGRLYVKVFVGSRKISLGVIDPPVNKPFGHLAIYFEDYTKMLSGLKGKCARKKFINIIRELTVFEYKIGNYIKGENILWDELWKIKGE